MILFLPVLSAFLWAIVNFIDKFLISSVLKNSRIGSLILFSSLSGVPVVFILLLIYKDVLFIYPLVSIFSVILSGVFFLLAVLFYLFALEKSETSTIVPQMLLIPISSAFFGIFILNEYLTYTQLTGAFFVIFGSFIINFHKKTTYFGNIQVFLLMFIDAVFAGLSITIYKLGTIDTMPFWHSIFWEHIGFIIFSIFVFSFISKYRSDFIYLLKSNRLKIVSLNVFSEAITLVGNFLFNYSSLLVPVGIITVLAEGSQPIIVFVLSLFLSRFSNLGIEETFNLRSMLTKISSIVLLIFGIYLFSISNEF